MFVPRMTPLSASIVLRLPIRPSEPGSGESQQRLPSRPLGLFPRSGSRKEGEPVASESFGQFHARSNGSPATMTVCFEGTGSGPLPSKPRLPIGFSPASVRDVRVVRRVSVGALTRLSIRIEFNHSPVCPSCASPKAVPMPGNKGQRRRHPATPARTSNDSIDQADFVNRLFLESCAENLKVAQSPAQRGMIPPPHDPRKSVREIQGHARFKNCLR